MTIETANIVTRMITTTAAINDSHDLDCFSVTDDLRHLEIPSRGFGSHLIFQI